IIKNCFFDNQWTILFTNFQFVDFKLQNRGQIEKRILKRFYFNYFLKVTLFLMFIAYVDLIWTQLINLSFWKGLFLGPFIDLFHEYLIISFLSALVECLKVRYQHLCARILTISKNVKMGNLFQELRKL